MFVEQYRAVGRALTRAPFDIASPTAEDHVASIFAGVARETEDEFIDGLTAAIVAGMEWGWSRVAGTAREAMPAFEPPKAPWSTKSQVPVTWTRVGPGYVMPDDYKATADLTGSPFKVANREAVAAARRHAGLRVAGIDLTTRDRLRNFIANGRQLGMSSEELAKQLRAADIPTTYKPLDSPSPLRHIRDRAHLIAVTETSYAYESGQRLGAKASADAGLRMVKSWLTVGDGAVDDVCQFNETDGEIPFEDPFTSGDGQPPAHPGCRCTTEYRALSSAEMTDLYGSPDPFEPGGLVDLLANPPSAPIDPAGQYAPHPEPLRFGGSEDKYRSWANKAMRGDPAGLKLKPDVRQAFADYSGSFYRIINESSRGLSLGSRASNRAIGLIDKAMLRLRGAGPTRKPIQLFRGIPESTAQRLLNVNGAWEVKPGMSFVDNAFQSASASKEVASHFGSFIMDVSIPAGTKVRFMGYAPGGGALSNISSELETLIERGCTMVIREAPKRQIDNTWLVKVDLYPPPATPPLPPLS